MLSCQLKGGGGAEVWRVSGKWGMYRCIWGTATLIELSRGLGRTQFVCLGCNSCWAKLEKCWKKISEK